MDDAPSNHIAMEQPNKTGETLQVDVSSLQGVTDQQYKTIDTTVDRTSDPYSQNQGPEEQETDLRSDPTPKITARAPATGQHARVANRRRCVDVLSLIFLIAGFVLFIIGFSTTHWSRLYDGTNYVSTGLWRICYPTDCRSISSDYYGGNWFNAVRILMCFALVFLVVSSTLAIVQISTNKHRVALWIEISISSYLAGAFVLTSVWVYDNNYYSGYLEFSYSSACFSLPLILTSAILASISACTCCVASCHCSCCCCKVNNKVAPLPDVPMYI